MKKKDLISTLNNISQFEWIVISTISLTFFLRIYFYHLHSKLLKQIKHSYKSDYFVPISIIIAAKNEAENLQNFLPDILQQDYPKFEVIVVNDGSIDDTEDILSRFKKDFFNLKTTFIKPNSQFKHNKKLAISIGIKAAQYEHLVFTDADCCVATNQWLKLMARNFQNHDIVLGYGGYLKNSSFLNMLIRYDTLRIGMLYLSKAITRQPYMGVGRNLAYTKSIYQNTKGFSSHYFVETGDDDLFVNQASTDINTTIETSPNAFTFSVSPKSFKEWMQQKSRHLSGSKYYRLGQKLFLGIESFSRSTFFIMIVFSLIFFKHIFIILVAILILDTILYYIINKPLFKHFGENKLLIFGIFFDILVTFLIFIRLSLNIFTRQNKR